MLFWRAGQKSTTSWKISPWEWLPRNSPEIGGEFKRCFERVRESRTTTLSGS